MSTGTGNTPTPGLSGLRENLRHDLISGFSVSLIALPLCLGIALASGVPPMAGLTAAIIGGLLVSRVTGSHVTITGPAAGLIVVTLGAVESMGGGDPVAGYHYALAAIVVAGVIELGLGLLKVGKLGDFFPSAAVHGMLAAIGVIIMIKQLFVALGTSAEGHELFEVIGEIPHGVANANPYIAAIALVSLAILIAHPHIKLKPVQAIPAPMWVLLGTIPLAHALDLFTEHSYTFAGATHTVGPQYLVNLPDSLLDGIAYPDFSLIGTGVFWGAVVAVCLVSSIESLLSAAAVDTLDPFGRKSDLNRDLGAMGAGSALSGLLGGLPMISEIVRSSANINAGARTQWANFFHGGFLLLYLLVASSLIEQIPLAALAAMLIHTGYRLAAPAEFKHTYEIGRAQLVIFVVTLLTVLATDLILGIIAGILCKLVIHFLYGTRPGNVFRIRADVERDGGQHIVRVRDTAIFSNYLGLKKLVLAEAGTGSVVVDLANVRLLDHTTLDHLRNLIADLRTAGRECELRGLDALEPVSGHPEATRLLRGGRRSRETPSPTPHQQRLATFARGNGLTFAAGPAPASGQHHEFLLLRGAEVELEQNVMSGALAGTVVDYAELRIRRSEGTSMKTEDLPVVTIGNLSEELPDFVLTAERATDELLARAGWDDIDFGANPQFSSRYLLRGSDEHRIRAFFSTTLLSYLLEVKRDYRIEARNGRLLITGEGALPSTAGEEMMNFALVLAQILPRSARSA